MRNGSHTLGHSIDTIQKRLCVVFAALALAIASVPSARAIPQNQSPAPHDAITVKGTVRNSGGEPLEGVTVLLQEKDNSGGVETVSKADGTFVLSAARRGQEAPCDPVLTCVSYHALAPARAALSGKMRSEIEQPGMGPESLRTHLAQMRAADLGLGKSGDTVLARFQLKLLTEGSGTQVFGTTFAQWAAREALRRAQPLTLLVRFALRQRQKPMNEMLAAAHEPKELDPLGSLADAEMGAYYNWLNQQRLPGSERSSFLVWFEGHNQAVAIGPSLPRGTESNGAVDLQQLLNWAT